MNFDEMEAGREMDILVIEKVLEWQLVPDSNYHGCGGAMFAVTESSERRFMWHLEADVYSGEKRWSPSTNIAAAWQVDRPTWVWRFYEAKYGLEVTLDFSGRTVFADVLWSEVGNKALAYALGRCRAALKATAVVPCYISECLKLD